MAALTKTRMNVDEYLAWAEGRPGRYELYDGLVYAMSPERVIHAKIKLAVHLALVAAIRGRGLPCHVLPDGVTVRIDAATAYEPDASVYSTPDARSPSRSTRSTAESARSSSSPRAHASAM